MTQRKPEWLKQKLDLKNMKYMQDMLTKLSLNTVCQGANCPNIGECFKKKTATFMILGDICTRNCTYCANTKGQPGALDPNEPENVAKAAKELGLKHVVVTSVTRDDLEDGGANHFAQTIRKIYEYLPDSTVEVLIPDLKLNKDALNVIINEKPDIINHNIETVPSLYSEVRPMADYQQSLDVLAYVKEKDSSIYTKSGIMVGLGETEEEVLRAMDDLIQIKCDILTIGQYLRPSSKHIKISEYITPEKFKEYGEIAEKKGFKFVASAPMVRSSYNAIEGMNKIKKG